MICSEIDPERNFHEVPVMGTISRQKDDPVAAEKRAASIDGPGRIRR